MSTFQTFVLGLFIVFLLGGVAAFALFRGGSANALPPLVLWGTLPSSVASPYFASDAVGQAGLKITYVEKDPATLEDDLTESLAKGLAPDLVIFPHDYLYRGRTKLAIIPFSIFSERDFRDAFIDGADVFLAQDGVIGVPLYIDPLVMYFNRNMFSSKAIANPPKYWDEFYTLAPKFNERNQAGNLTRTIVSFGETSNIAHFKELLTNLILQAGNPIITISERDGAQVVLNDNKTGLPNSPAESALLFYTTFSNPVEPAYSWNKSLLNSRDAFVGETLGTYFGLGSELSLIRARNPNLNFYIAPLPQIRDSQNRLSFGRVYGLVIPKNSRNAGAAMAAAKILSGSSLSYGLVASTGLPPARRDLLSTPQEDVYRSILYSSAIMTRVWPDPSYGESTGIFRDMIDSVTSGKLRLSTAVDQATKKLEILIQKYAQ